MIDRIGGCFCKTLGRPIIAVDIEMAAPLSHLRARQLQLTAANLPKRPFNFSVELPSIKHKMGPRLTGSLSFFAVPVFDTLLFAYFSLILFFRRHVKRDSG